MVEKTNYEFNCGYCGKVFTQKVGTFNRITDQVKCTKCGNFLKSDEGKRID